MIYYLTLTGTETAGNTKFSFIAQIESRYYVQVDGEKRADQSVSISMINGGFINSEMQSLLNEESKTNLEQLRKTFGSFAQHLERIADGFRSYMHWIRPETEGNGQWEFSS